MTMQFYSVIKPFSGDRSGVPLFSIVANEIYFLPHLLAHYRRLGVGEFHFLVDRSDDGTREYLMAQDDCAVLSSDYRFKDPVQIEVGGKTIKRRFADACRFLVPREVFEGRWGLVVDADEFLLLPPPCKTMQAFVERLDRHGLTCCRAPMVDFYPDRLSDLDADDLMGRSPFEVAPNYDLVTYDWPAGLARPLRIAHDVAVRTRLYEKIIADRPELAEEMRFGADHMLHKIPLLRWHAGTTFLDAHTPNHAPSDRVQAVLAHFKFYPGWMGKVEGALLHKQYVGESVKYRPLEYAARCLADWPLRGPESRRAPSAEAFASGELIFDRLDEALTGRHGPADSAGSDVRTEWVERMWRIVEPVLVAGARGALHEELPVWDRYPGRSPRSQFAPLEASARTLAGIAPWLALDGLDGAEGVLQARARELAAEMLDAITNRAKPSCAVFDRERQPLVEAAHIALAILRAPGPLWNDLPPAVRTNVAAALGASRNIRPYQNNWLLFSALIEVFHARAGLKYKPGLIKAVADQFERWYVGDGMYSDGPHFRLDYYNAYVIHPFLVEIAAASDSATGLRDRFPKYIERAQRHAVQLERLIAQDGSMPALGRSLTYRCGNLHLLAQLATIGELPGELPPGQVREAITAAMRRMLDAPGTCDERGWLTPGMCGSQPGLRDFYTSTGSLYLCLLAFLPLGLSAHAPFWRDPPRAITSQRLSAGEDLEADKAYDADERGWM